MKLQFFEGETSVTNENLLLGTFVIDGIPPLPKAQAKVELTLKMSLLKRLHLEAKEVT